MLKEEGFSFWYVWRVCSCLCVSVMVSDYASCLHMLMKYPPIADMQYFIDMARYLREPNVCCLSYRRSSSHVHTDFQK